MNRYRYTRALFVPSNKVATNNKWEDIVIDGDDDRECYKYYYIDNDIVIFSRYYYYTTRT